MLKQLHVSTVFDLSPSSLPRNVTHSWIGSVFGSFHRYPTTLQVYWRSKGIAFLELETKQAATANEGGEGLMQSREEEERRLCWIQTFVDWVLKMSFPWTVKTRVSS